MGLRTILKELPELIGGHYSVLFTSEQKGYFQKSQTLHVDSLEQSTRKEIIRKVVGYSLAALDKWEEFRDKRLEDCGNLAVETTSSLMAEPPRSPPILQQ